MTSIAAGFLFGLLLAADHSPPGVQQMPSGVLLECEDFELGGKWKLQVKKHPGFSGKGYCTETASAGIARFTPSKTVTLPKPGGYNVWVRAYLGGKPDGGICDRELAIEVNGKLLDSTHRGFDGDRYRWELAGMVQVGPDARAVVRIHDLGRSPAVADCLLLTDDLEFKPISWTANSRRPSLSVPFQPPAVKAVEAQPYVLPKAANAHTENLTDSTCRYRVSVGGTLDEFNTVQYLDTYGLCKRLESRFQPNEYLVIENVGQCDVVNPRIVINGRRDWFSAESILASILRPGMTEAEKAIAIWGFTSSIEVQCHENNRRVGPYYADEKSQPSRNTYKERANPVKAANSYYCSGCQLSATNCVVLLREAGLAARAVWMCPIDEYENHCVAEAWYDGGWHLFDPERRSFYLESDNTTVASYETLHKNPGLAARTHDNGFAVPYMTKRTHAKEYEKYYPPSVMPVARWVGTMGTTLRPGEKFIWRWDHIEKFRCGHNPRNRNYRPYRLANGKAIYRPDLTNPNFRKGILSERNIKTSGQDGQRPAVHADRAGDVSFVTYQMKTAYPIVGGIVGGKFFRKTNADVCKIHISVSDSDWTEVWSAADTGSVEPCVAIDRIMNVKFRAPVYECFVKYEFRAAALPTDAGLDGAYMEFDVQMSSASLPSLSVGSNEVLYRDDGNAQSKVRITHGWRESSATRPPLPPAKAVSPGDGFKGRSKGTAPKKLVWAPAPDPDGNAPDGDEIVDYHVRVSPRRDMLHAVSPNFDQLTSSGKPEWDVPPGWLVEGRSYYWRVRARDKWGVWSQWSDVWTFQFGQ